MEQFKKKGISKGKIPGCPSSETTPEAKVLIENEIKFKAIYPEHSKKIKSQGKYYLPNYAEGLANEAL